MNHINITATFQNDEKITIISQHWRVLAKGDGHIILENIIKEDLLYKYVLSVCRHETNSLPEQFQSAYELILKNVSEIQKYLLEKKELMMLPIEKDKFKKIVEKLSACELGAFRVFLSQHLTQDSSHWDYSLQFKPKTPLPQKYSFNFLKRYCQKHKKNFDELIELLDQSPSVEKIRWFKKNSLKQKKRNINSLQIFSVKGHHIPTYSDHLKSLNSKVDKLSALQNESIHEYIKTTQVLNGILKMQLLHTVDNDFQNVSLPLTQGKQTSENKKIINQILQQILMERNLDEIVEKLYQESTVCFKNVRKVDNFETFLRFLVSWSWRDVSLIIRFKINKDNDIIQQSDLKIIDYQLKEVRKLTSTIKKDQTFLTYYLTSKHFL